MAKADLVQPLAFAHQNGKAARADLGIEGAVIGLGDPVELYPAVGDGAGQKVKPAGRAFGIGHRRYSRRQGKAFGQRDDVDAVLFQHGAFGKVHLVHGKLAQAVLHGFAMSGQKRGAHAVGHGAEAQIKACGLKLILADGRVGGQGAVDDQLAQGLCGQHAVGHDLVPLSPVVPSAG